MEKKISVIVPVYNVEKYLERCLNSIIGQTYENLEIIVVDDGATDSSGAIADQFAAKDSRIRVIHQENKGLGSARNTGINAASGDYFAFVDSDDWLEKDAYEVMCASMEQYSCDIVTCARRVIWAFSDDETIEYDFCLEEGVLVQSKQEIIRRYLFDDGLNMASWDKLFRKELFDDIRFPEGHMLSEDFLPIFQLLAKADSIYLTGKPLYNYFHHPYSLSMTAGVHSSRLIGIALYSSQVADIVRRDYPEMRQMADMFLAKSLAYAYSCARSNDDEEARQAQKDLHPYFKAQIKNIYRNPYVKRNLKAYSFFALIHLDRVWDNRRKFLHRS